MASQESSIKFTFVGTTDVGRVREHNEDNFLAVNLAEDKRGGSGEVVAGSLPAKGLSLVVCDGMGGAAAGEVASQMAVDILHESFKNADLGGTVRAEPDVIGVLETAINKANEAIFRKGAESKEHQGMARRSPRPSSSGIPSTCRRWGTRAATSSARGSSSR